MSGHEVCKLGLPAAPTPCSDRRMPSSDVQGRSATQKTSARQSCRGAARRCRCSAATTSCVLHVRVIVRVRLGVRVRVRVGSGAAPALSQQANCLDSKSVTIQHRTSVCGEQCDERAQGDAEVHMARCTVVQSQHVLSTAWKAAQHSNGARKHTHLAHSFRVLIALLLRCRCATRALRRSL